MSVLIWAPYLAGVKCSVGVSTSEVDVLSAEHDGFETGLLLAEPLAEGTFGGTGGVEDTI
jgi:hypothetical protein